MPGEHLRRLGMHTAAGQIGDEGVTQRMKIHHPAPRIQSPEEVRLLPHRAFPGR